MARTGSLSGIATTRARIPNISHAFNSADAPFDRNNTPTGNERGGDGHVGGDDVRSASPCPTRTPSPRRSPPTTSPPRSSRVPNTTSRSKHHSSSTPFRLPRRRRSHVKFLSPTPWRTPPRRVRLRRRHRRPPSSVHEPFVHRRPRRIVHGTESRVRDVHTARDHDPASRRRRRVDARARERPPRLAPDARDHHHLRRRLPLVHDSVEITPPIRSRPSTRLVRPRAPPRAPRAHPRASARNPPHRPRDRAATSTRSYRRRERRPERRRPETRPTRVARSRADERTNARALTPRSMMHAFTQASHAGPRVRSTRKRHRAMAVDTRKGRGVGGVSNHNPSCVPQTHGGRDGAGHDGWVRVVGRDSSVGPPTVRRARAGGARSRPGGLVGYSVAFTPRRSSVRTRPWLSFWPWLIFYVT